MLSQFVYNTKIIKTKNNNFNLNYNLEQQSLSKRLHHLHGIGLFHRVGGGGEENLLLFVYVGTLFSLLKESYKPRGRIRHGPATLTVVECNYSTTLLG